MLHNTNCVERRPMSVHLCKLLLVYFYVLHCILFFYLIVMSTREEFLYNCLLTLMNVSTAKIIRPQTI